MLKGLKNKRMALVLNFGFFLFVLLLFLPQIIHAQHPPPDTIPQISLFLTLSETQMPSYQLLGSSLSLNNNATLLPTPVQFSKHPTHHTSRHTPNYTPPKSKTSSQGFVDNWKLLVSDDIEGGFPDINCTVFDNNPTDTYEYYWGNDDFKSASPTHATWPAKLGEHGRDPATNSYPPNADSWLDCGPFDYTNAERLLVRFNRWLEMFDTDDGLTFGISTDGINYNGLRWTGTSNWVYSNIYSEIGAGSNKVYMAWIFESDADTDVAQGPWLDDLEIWRYNTPSVTCADYDPGTKGLVIPPYDPTETEALPIIRADDLTVLNNLIQDKVNWVRLGFIRSNGIVNLQDYDRMIDTLCANNMSVLGLLTHEILARDDYNDPDETIAAEYRAEYVAQATFITNYMQGRIKYYEIWNEPEYEFGALIKANYYALLLNDTYTAIKNDNPDALILFGGLAGAWDTGYEYLEAVYAYLNNDLGGARPFDYLAIHPYPNDTNGNDPNKYMYSYKGYYTIIDRFLKLMSDNSDGNKKIWITESGWNTSKNSPNRPTCHEKVLITEIQQQVYLKSLFDILFNEVTMWQDPNTLAIEKVFFYQYMDVGAEDPCQPKQNNSRAYVPYSGMSINGVVDWWYGIYRGDKITPKPAQCAFAIYPNLCPLYVYLPLVLKN